MIDTGSSFINAVQAAQFLGGLNARTVTRWAREGYLPSYPIGEGKRRLWRFQKADLTTWMLCRRQMGLGTPGAYPHEEYTRHSHRCSDRGLIQ